MSILFCEIKTSLIVILLNLVGIADYMYLNFLKSE